MTRPAQSTGNREKVLTGQELQIRERGEDGKVGGARGLTEQQRALVSSFATTGSVSATAKEVGVRPDQASNTLRLAHVQAALHGECQAMFARAVPIAFNTMISIAKNKDAPDRVRLDAAKALADRAGFGPSKDRDNHHSGKRDLSDLSLAELAAFIQQGQAKASAVDAAGTITTPDTDLDTS